MAGGSRSIARSTTGRGKLYAVHPDGTTLIRLARYGSNSNVSWSRDGKLAVIGSHQDERSSHLIVIDVRTRRVTVLQSGLGGGTVAWSPTGHTIAYATTIGQSNVSALYTVRADGTDRHRLTPSRAPYSDGSAVWSPDGKSLLFVRTPLGAGAERETSEVWTMRLDGSHQHQLTHAYPAGGDNSEPAWTNGPVHVVVAPRSQETRHGETVVLRVPFAVDGIAADVGHAAIAPLAYEMERDVKPTPPILLWRPGDGEQARLIASQCGGISELVLTGSRLALDCDQQYFDQIAQAVWVYDLRTAVPREVFSSEAGPARSANGDILGMYVDNIVGGRGLLAFGSSRVKASTYRTARAVADRRALQPQPSLPPRHRRPYRGRRQAPRG